MLPQITHEHACCSISVLAISSPESGGDISLLPRLAALPGQVRMLILLTFAAIAFLSDQISKRVVQTRVVGAVGGPLFQIREVHHRERIYGHAGFRAALIVIWCLAAIAAVWLHSSGWFLQSRLALTGMGCALGGAAGNLLDILRRRHVIDFIDLGWWPVFNLADVAIVGGLLLAFWGMVPHV